MTDPNYDKYYVDRQICKSCEKYSYCPYTGNIDFDKCSSVHKKEVQDGESKQG